MTSNSSSRLNKRNQKTQEQNPEDEVGCGKTEKVEKPATKEFFTFLENSSIFCYRLLVFGIGLLSLVILYAFLFGNLTNKDIRLVSEYAQVADTLEEVGLLEKPDSKLRQAVVYIAEMIPYALPPSIVRSLVNSILGYPPNEVDLSNIDKEVAKRLPTQDVSSEQNYYYHRMKQLEQGSINPNRVKTMLDGQGKQSKGLFSRGYSDQDLGWILN